MLVTTQDEFAEYEIVETLGLVKGNTIRARHVGYDVVASLRKVVGGEISEYTEMLADAREEALHRMIAEAQRLGADGIVCIRFTTSEVMQATAELLAYGTAVKLRKKGNGGRRSAVGGQE
jgi:uncharacterized protein YbjQ (UPF0145 family)